MTHQKNKAGILPVCANSLFARRFCMGEGKERVEGQGGQRAYPVLVALDEINLLLRD